jgi:WD40 repeat protein/tRNA A-37 threonylcarbamoyl transferase component Bud32
MVDSTHASPRPGGHPSSSGGPADRFSRLWRQGQRPDLAEFLSKAGQVSPRDLAAILRTDQRERWQAGNRVPAEDYMRDDLGVAVDSDTAVDLVYQEFLLREEMGETPTAEEYQQRFPQLAQQLAQQIEFHQALEPPEGPDSSKSPTVATPADAKPTAEGWPDIPGYAITAELGRGGMGVVYQARQWGLNRQVALKMILDGTRASPEERVRFHAEAEAVAQLQHPHIVQIYDVGEHAGCTYLALEFVDGGSLAQKVGGTPLPARQAAEIMETVARAVHFAHQRRIVHRDLKPANILLTTEGVPKISDFGLAKRTEYDARLTGSGGVLGTPSFMPPEQAAGKSGEIGPLVDVYALGATLYFLLTGRPPFQAANATETLRQVIDEDPVAPRRLNPAADRDLETICLKCLEKTPQRRYASAGDLADDLRRYLDGRPILARRASWREHGWRWVRRNPGWAATLATALGLLLVLAVGGTILSVQLQRALSAARQAEYEKTEKLFQSYVDRANAERMSGRVGQRFKALAAIREAAQIRITPELQEQAIAALVLPDLEIAREWEAYHEDTAALGFDRNFDRYARVNNEGEVTICRFAGEDEEVLLQLPAHGEAAYFDPLFSPDGRFVICGSLPPGAPGSRVFRLWKLDPDASVVMDETQDWHESAIGFRPDSSQLAVAHADGSISVYDLETGGRVHRLKVEIPPMHLAFHPRDSRLAVASGKSVRLFDLASGRELPPLKHAAKVHYLAWHPDGKRMAVACYERTIHLWDVEAARELMMPWTGHVIDGIHLTFNRAGDRLLSKDWGANIRLWNVATGQLLLTTAINTRLQLSTDDRLLGWERAGRNVRVFRMAFRRELQVLERREADDRELIIEPIVHADGWLLAGRTPKALPFFDLSSGEELAALRLTHDGSIRPVRFIPQEGLLTGGTSGLLSWPLRADPAGSSSLRLGPPQSRASVDDPKYTNGTGTSLDGAVLAVPLDSFALVFHRDRPDKPLRLGPQHDVRWSPVSPDGRWVVTCSHWRDGRSKSARIWEAATGQHLLDLPLEGSTLAGFSPDGRWLATNTDGTGFRLWEVGTWREERRSAEAAFAFSPDGKLLALTDTFGVIRLVETATDREVARLTGPEPMWYSPHAFTSDGTKLIATCSSYKAIYVWDLRLIRQGLVELGLDWDWPEFSPQATAPDAGPLHLTIDAGHLAPAAEKRP